MAFHVGCPHRHSKNSITKNSISIASATGSQFHLFLSAIYIYISTRTCSQLACLPAVAAKIQQHSQNYKTLNESWILYIYIFFPRCIFTTIQRTYYCSFRRVIPLVEKYAAPRWNEWSWEYTIFSPVFGMGFWNLHCLDQYKFFSIGARRQLFSNP